MANTEPRALLDHWPVPALGAIALFAIVVVLRGMKRPADASKNRASGGGSTVQGRGGRW